MLNIKSEKAIDVLLKSRLALVELRGEYQDEEGRRECDEIINAIEMGVDALRAMNWEEKKCLK